MIYINEETNKMLIKLQNKRVAMAIRGKSGTVRNKETLRRVSL